jgi:hypothetical protein
MKNNRPPRGGRLKTCLKSNLAALARPPSQEANYVVYSTPRTFKSC